MRYSVAVRLGCRVDAPMRCLVADRLVQVLLGHRDMAYLVLLAGPCQHIVPV